MAAFAANRPELDLRTLDLHRRRAWLETITSGSPDAPSAYAIAVYQRLLRLIPPTRGAPSPTPAEDELVQALHRAGFASAHDVAALSERRFVARVAGELPGGDDAAAAATAIHRRAVATRSLIQHVALSARLVAGSPHARAQPSHHASRDLIAYLEAIPSYDEMFGGLDYCECAECQSIFGPAAYLVDLLRLVDTYIVEENDIPANWRLDIRRPDLYTTPLDCAATTTVVPYLALVDAILAEQIKNRTGTEAYQIVAAASYPFNLPFSLPLAQIREYLGRLQASLAGVFASFVVPAPGTGPVTPLAAARERLGISIEQLAVVTTPRTTEDSLAPYYGYAVILPIAELSRVSVFLARTGLTRDRLVELLTQGLSARELADGAADRLFINATGEGLPAMALRYEQVGDDLVETIADLTLLRLDRLNRFLRLSAHTALSFADLDWALATAPSAAITPGSVESLAALVGLAADTAAPAVELTGLWSDLKTSGRGNGRYPADPFDRIFNNPAVLGGRDPYTIEPAIPFDPARPLAWEVASRGDVATTIRGRLTASLAISIDDLTRLAAYLLALLGIDDGILTTDLATLSWLYRLARQARLMRLSVDAYLRLVGLVFYPGQPYRSPAPGAWTATQANVDRLFDVGRWLAGSGFDAFTLAYVLTGEASPSVAVGYREADLGAWLDALVGSSADDRLVAADLVFGDVTRERADEIYKLLIRDGFVNSAGVALPRSAGFADLAIAFPVGQDAFYAPGLITIAESRAAYVLLVARGILLDPAGAASATLSSSYTAATPLDFLFDGDADAPAKRDRVRDLLVAVKTDIDELVRIVTGATSAQTADAQAALADLLDAAGDRVATVLPVAIELAQLPAYLAALLTPRPAGKLPVGVPELVRALARYLRLFDTLELDDLPIRAVLAIPASFDITDPNALTIDDVRSLTSFVELEAAFQDRDHTLVRCYFGAMPDGCRGSKVAILSALSGWPVAQIEYLEAMFWPGVQPSPPPSETVAGLRVLQRVFDQASALALDAPALAGLAELSAVALLDAEGTLIKASWDRWTRAARDTLSAAAARFRDGFAEVVTEIETALVAVQRDALLGYTVWLLAGAGLPIASVSDLFDYFLIDVEMGGTDRTSWVAQAVQSVQLYLQRSRLQVEPGVARVPVPAVWWSWFSSYRIWEANRKIFVYPESYVDPELLRTASPIFRQLAEELRQSEVDDRSVAAAYTKYFDAFAVAASLVQSSSYRARVVDPDSGKETETLFLIGRTLTAPYAYHVRTLTAGRRWSAWSPIDISIAASTVSASYAFGRLMVFWAELAQTNSSGVSGGNADAQAVTRATLRYSFQDASGKWVQPQVLCADYVQSAVPATYGLVNDDPAIAALFDPDSVAWEAPHVLVVGRGIPAQGRLTVIAGLHAAFGFATNLAEEVTEGDRIWVAGQERKVLKVDGKQLLVADAWTMSASLAEFKVIPADPGTASYPSFQGDGTVLIVEGIANVAGRETAFERQISVGDRISVNGETRTVLLVSVTGSQQLFVDFPWATSVSGATYTITPTASGQDRVLVLYGSGLDTQDRVPPPIPLPPIKDNGGRDPFVTARNEFNRDLFQTLVLADRITRFVAPGTAEAPAGHVTAGIAIQMTEDLIPNIGRALLLGYTYGADYTQLSNLQPYQPFVDRNNSVLSIVPGSDVVADAVWSNAGRVSLATAAPRFAALAAGTASLPLLYNIPDRTSAVGNVINQTGWFTYSSGNESFVVMSQEPGLLDTTALLFVRPYLTSGVYRNEITISAAPYTNQPIAFDQLTFRFTRLSTSVVGRMSSVLLARGLDGLLRLETQMLPELPFSRFYSDATGKPAPAIDAAHLPPPVMDFDGAYGQYFWEVFFYGPFLIAGRLATHRRFEDAKRWYERIFNPTQPADPIGAPDDRFWRFRPFRPLDVESLARSLTNVEQIDAYNDDPFDPDAIARLRPGAYPKAIAIRYIANVIDWGDRLFTEDTREAIGQATNLYLMASDLLGPRPVAVGPCPAPSARSYEQIRAGYDTTGTVAGATANTIVLDQAASARDRFYNGLHVAITAGTGNGQRRVVIDYQGATRTATVDPPWERLPAQGSTYRITGLPQFLIEVENASASLLDTPGIAYGALPYNLFDSYFCVPDNANLIALWDRVEDRLFKIRNSMNIDGVVRALPLFAPPIDPGQLVSAAAGGGPAGGSGTAVGEPPTSPYRFEYLVSQATSIAGTVVQFGQSLLLALEKKDAESLSLLQNTQAQALLRLTVAAKQAAITEAERQHQALLVARDSARYRQTYYAHLIAAGLSPSEIENLDAMADGLGYNILATVTKTAASIAYAIPQLGSPFAMTYGGVQLGSALNAASAVFEIGAMIQSYIAQRSITVAGYERRAQEWELQTRLAGFDAQQTEQLIAAAALRVEMARQDLRLTEQQLAQTDAVTAFLHNKFTSVQLYEWMTGQLATLYFQAYQVAFELARAAQRAYDFRLGTGRSFIRASSWDSLRKGLLSGEGLVVALSQLERAYTDDNHRRFEITKTIALSQLDPRALLRFRDTGECMFSLGELIYDQDYPGHYARTITSVSVSIPAVIGPYQNLKATLTQLTNQIVVEPNLDAIAFLLGDGTAAFPPSALRSNWRALQEVALSRGLDDTGLFQTDLADPRYLPFEGTGAVSTWRLAMPPQTNRFDFTTIGDVLLTVRYTALDSGLRAKVVALPALRAYRGAALLLLRQSYPQPWHLFMTDHASAVAQTLQFAVPRTAAPVHVRDVMVTGFYLQLAVADGVVVPPGSQFLAFEIAAGETVSITMGANAGARVTLPVPVRFQDVSEARRRLSFDLAAVPAGLLRDGFLDPDRLLGIGLILDLDGTIAW